MNRYASLREDIEEEKKYEREGAKRLCEYYLAPEGEREKLMVPSIAPHELLAERASNLILIALQTMEGEHDIEEERIDYILIGVAVEVLVKSIILKESPRYFICKMRGEKAASYEICHDKLLQLLSPDLTGKQVERLRDVLDLVQQKRNNLVHFAFHRMDSYLENYQVANVLAFLFSRFFGQTVRNVVGKLIEFKESERKQIGSGMDYEGVDFPTGEKS